MMADLLIGNGADVNCKTKKKQTPLYLASKKGHTPLVLFLWERGAEINAITEALSTALHVAASSGHSDTIRVLLHHQAYINCRNAKFSTPLHKAAKKGHVLCCSLLAEKGADLKIKDSSGHVALDYCKFSIPTIV